MTLYSKNRVKSLCNSARILAVAGAVIGSVAISGTVQAQNVPWQVVVMPARTPISNCRNVISQTAREAVQRCLAKAGIVLPFADYIVSAAPVCKTKYAATSTKGTGYVYSQALAPILTPACG